MTSGRRARQLGRMRQAEQAARQAAHRQRRRRRMRIGAALAGVAVALAGVGVGIASAVGAGSHPVAARAAGGPCDYRSAPKTPGGRYVGLPPDRRDTGHPVARMVTNRGTVVMDLEAAAAPCTVNAIEFLARHGYYNHTPCHRLTTSGGLYVLQCGDPTGTGQGGPGFTIPDENLAGATYTAGTVAMANTGAPHSGGSQFFIVYRTSQLPPHYTPFARVVSGLGVIRQVAAKGATPAGDGRPLEPVEIESFTVTG